MPRRIIVDKPPREKRRIRPKRAEDWPKRSRTDHLDSDEIIQIFQRSRRGDDTYEIARDLRCSTRVVQKYAAMARDKRIQPPVPKKGGRKPGHPTDVVGKRERRPRPSGVKEYQGKPLPDEKPKETEAERRARRFYVGNFEL